MQHLEVSGEVRPIYGSLGVKRLTIVKTLYVYIMYFSLCIKGSNFIFDPNELLLQSMLS